MRTVNVKTVSRGDSPPVALERPRRQMQEYLRFRVLVNEMVEINEQLCDARIKADRTAKKGALEKTYRLKSPPSSSWRQRPRSTRCWGRNWPMKWISRRLRPRRGTRLWP